MTTTASPMTRRWWVWPLLFASFPLSGLAASVLVGPATTVPAALLGGAVVGLVLGATTALALRRPPARWVLATTIGLTSGTAALVLIPALGPVIQGLLLATSQSLSRAPLHPVIWIPLVTASWAAGWAVSWFVAIRDEPGFVVFGVSGALLVTAVLFAVSRVEERRSR